MSIETMGQNLFFKKVGGLFVVDFFVIGWLAFAMKHNCIKSAHTLSEAIYIRSDVCQSLHCALEKKIKTPKGGRKK